MKLDEWAIYLSKKAAKDLNGLALEQEPKIRLREDDQVTGINGLEGSGEELLTTLLGEDPEMPEIVLRIGRGKAELKFLRQLKPPFKQMQPCPTNSTFFLLRSSTDGSLRLSVIGFGEHQVWSSTIECNRAFEKEFHHKQHVFFLMLYRREFRGLLRMCSPQDEKEYGSNSHWCYAEGDRAKWSWLATNFKVQWIKECAEHIDSCPRFDAKASNRSYLQDKKDGYKFSPEESAWDVAEHLVRCPSIRHAELSPQQTAPSDGTQNYQRHVHRPSPEYYRGNAAQHQVPFASSVVSDVQELAHIGSVPRA